MSTAAAATAAAAAATATPSPAVVFEPRAAIEEYYVEDDGNKFSGINKPTAGAQVEQALPTGSAALQLYSLATPNGQKVGVLLEELGLDYDAHTVNILKGEQFTSGFVDVCPNSKIPCLVDTQGPPVSSDGGAAQPQPIHLFETASIMLYLADKFNPELSFRDDPRLRAELLNWTFWQMAGQGPMAGNFGHFMVYAPDDQVGARTYGVKRYGMETQRLCDVLDRHLAGRQFMVGERFSVADMVCYPWFQQLRTGYKHKNGVGAAEFLGTGKYANAGSWADRVGAREAVKRGMRVCGWTSKNPKPWLEDDAKPE